MVQQIFIYSMMFIMLLFITTVLPYGRIFNNNYRDKCKNNKFKWNSKTFFVLLAIGIAAGLRDKGLGTDYEGYIEFYEYILDHGVFMHDTNEIGWNYINLWMAKLEAPSGFFFGMVSLVTWYFFISGSYKFQYLLPLMFFFVIAPGFFYWTLSGLRQSIAIMIFFFSIKYIVDRKMYQYIYMILIGSLFHLSALVLIPLYFFHKVKINRNIALALFFISTAFIQHELFVPVADKILLYFGSVDDLYSYTHYLKNEEMVLATENTGTGLGFILKTIFTVWIIIRSKSIIKKHSDLNIYYIFFLMYAIGNNLFFSVELVARVLNYLYICFPIIAAAVIYFSPRKTEKLIGLFFLVAFASLYLVTTYKFAYKAFVFT